MKKFFQHNGITVVIIALLLTAVISVGSVFLPNLTQPVSHALGVLGTPFRAAASFFVDRVEDAYSYAFSYHTLQRRVEELESRVADMELENREARDALEENRRLRDLLSLAQAHTDFLFESATVTGRSGNSWESALTISKGSSSGVEKDMCVVTENGYLVGVVADVGANWATVITLIDPDISMGVSLDESGEDAILTSDLNTMTLGLCGLSYLSPESQVSVGDTVLTSGLGGVYPPGLTVGTVTEQGLTASGMERYALIQPAAELDALRQVFVIKGFDVVE